jgi:hypothetical protein
MLKKFLIVAVIVGCFSFVEAKAQDCPKTPVRNLVKKVCEVQPLRTFCKKAYDARPIRTFCKKAYDARPLRSLFKRKPLRSLFKRKPLRSLLKGRSCSGSKSVRDNTVLIPLVMPVPVIPDA